MDLLVPCIVEGRSELRNVSRVNCKTHWLIYELRITLLTERISHFVAVLFRTLQCAWLSARCIILLILYCIYILYVYNYFESFYYTFLRVKYVILYINLLSNIFFYICKVYFYKILYLYINFYYIIFIIYLKNR